MIVLWVFLGFVGWCLLGLVAVSAIDRDGAYWAWLKQIPAPFDQYSPLVFAVIWPMLVAEWVRERI